MQNMCQNGKFKDLIFHRDNAPHKMQLVIHFHCYLEAKTVNIEMERQTWKKCKYIFFTKPFTNAHAIIVKECIV